MHPEFYRITLSSEFCLGALGRRGDLNDLARSYQQMFSHSRETQ